MTAFAYCVYGLIGLLALRFIFWEIPLRFQSYWKGVVTAAIGVSVLGGLGYLAQKDENATFWLSIMVIMVVVSLMFFSSRKS